MKTVPLHGEKAAGRVALVDDGDYGLVMQYRWNVWEDPGPGHRHTRGHGPYAMTKITRGGVETTTRMHQMITGWPLTDHKDHDGLNNQRSNLRRATVRQNGLNSRPALNRSSRFKGVSWHKQSQRWSALIRSLGTAHELGFYRDETDAARAYDAAARELFGEFAYLNFPESHQRPERAPSTRRPDISDAVIIALRDGGLTWDEIAAEVGMSQTGVRMRWNIAVNGSRPDRPKGRS